MTKIVRPRSEPDTPPAGPGPGPTPSPAPQARQRPLVPPRAPSTAKMRGKVLLSMLDGKIEWEKMTPESRKAFEELFRDPEFLTQFGLSGKAKFDPEQMKALYDGISMVYQTVIGMLLRWPTEALRLLAYTDEQKDMLAEPTARLADRFAPRILQNNQELIIWGSIFAAVTQKNFMTASAEAKKKMQEKNNQRGAPGAGPVRIPGPAPADRPAPKIAVPFAAPYDDEGQSLG